MAFSCPDDTFLYIVVYQPYVSNIKEYICLHFRKSFGYRLKFFFKNLGNLFVQYAVRWTKGVRVAKNMAIS